MVLPRPVPSSLAPKTPEASAPLVEGPPRLPACMQCIRAASRGKTNLACECLTVVGDPFGKCVRCRGQKVACQPIVQEVSFIWSRLLWYRDLEPESRLYGSKEKKRFDRRQRSTKSALATLLREHSIVEEAARQVAETTATFLRAVSTVALGGSPSVPRRR